jgi:hypothetical protein
MILQGRHKTYPYNKKNEKGDPPVALSKYQIQGKRFFAPTSV